MHGRVRRIVEELRKYPVQYGAAVLCIAGIAAVLLLAGSDAPRTTPASERPTQQHPRAAAPAENAQTTEASANSDDDWRAIVQDALDALAEECATPAYKRDVHAMERASDYLLRAARQHPTEEMESWLREAYDAENTGLCDGWDPSIRRRSKYADAVERIHEATRPRNRFLDGDG